MRGRGRVARRLSALGAALVVLSVTPAPAGATGPVVVDAHDGFSFALPAGWQQLSADPARTKAIMKKASSVSPQVATAVRQAIHSIGVSSLRIYAIGPLATGSTFAPNLNVIVESGRGVPTGAAFVQGAVPAAKQGLASIGAKNLGTSSVALAGAPALKVTYAIGANGRRGEGTLYYAAHGGRIDIITVTTASAATTTSAAATLQRTWRWR